jgi:hypothetical protein
LGDVTRGINKDWTTTYTGHGKYGEDLDKEKARMLKREAKRMGRNLRCKWPLGCKSADYRDRLVARDKAMPAYWTTRKWEKHAG